MSDLKIAAAYVRVSTEEQAELSPDSQLAVIRAYAEKNGYLIPDEYVFIDEGISGRTAKKRPAFNLMIATAKDGTHPVDVIIVWKFSRFARNQEESIVYKSMLHKDKVDVVSVSEPLIDGPFGSLIERILEWMDEYYSIRLSGEVKRSMTLNAQRGVRQIAPPFGYTLVHSEDGNRMVPDSVEGPIIKDIFRRFLSGEGFYAIARYLNDMGIKTHRGNRFENRTIEYIVRNPVYIGKMRWTPTGRCRRDFKNPDTIVCESAHEPLISQEDFAAAQVRVARLKEQWGYKARPSSELKDWLSGVIRCPSCGATLIFSKPHYFICNNFAHGSCKHSQHIRVDLLHEAFIAKLHEDADSSLLLAYVSHASEDTADELRRLKVAEAQFDKKLARARKAYTSGVDTLNEYKAFKDSCEKEHAEILSRLQEIENSLESVDSMALLRDSIKEALAEIERPDASKEGRNNAVRSIIENCTFDKAIMTLKITYRLNI